MAAEQNQAASADIEFVASDLEGTLSAGVTWEGMRDYLLAYGRQTAVRRFMRGNFLKTVRYKLGLLRDERAFKERWILDLLRLFTGFSQAQMDEVSYWVVEKTLWPARRQVVVDALRQHQENGRRVIIVSGLFAPMLEVFAAKLQMEAIGTPLRFENGRFTGEIAAPLNVGERKTAHLAALVPAGRLAAAYGDTVRDIPMLQMSREPVAVSPDAGLRTHAQAHGWRILDA